MSFLTAREFKARQEWVKKHLLYVAVPVVDAIQGGSASPSVPVPGAPVLSIDSYPSEGVVSLSWTEPSGSPTRYNIYVDGVFYDYTEGLSSGVSGLTLGVPTEIYVTAVNAGGEGDPSNTVTATAFILQDTFTDANGTLLSDHTPEQGGPWTNTGVIEIQSNKAKFLSLAPPYQFAFSTFPMATANGFMQADLTKVGPGDYGCVINVQDVNHLWMAWHSLNTVYLYEQTEQEAFTNRGSYSTSTAGTLKIEANGDTIKVYVDGVERISYTVGSRPYKASAAGGLMIYGTSPSGSSFDNALAGPL